MLELYMIVCLLSDPAKCQEQRLDFVSRNSIPAAVLKLGETEASQWIETHPAYYMHELHTRIPSSLEAKI